MFIFSLCLPTRCSSSLKDEASFVCLACALNLQNHQQGLYGVPLGSTGNRHRWPGAQLCSSGFLQQPLL